MQDGDATLGSVGLAIVVAISGVVVFITLVATGSTLSEPKRVLRKVHGGLMGLFAACNAL